jgi:hypothetical protein
LTLWTKRKELGLVIFQEKLGKETCCQTVLRPARKWYKDLLTFGITETLGTSWFLVLQNAWGLASFWYRALLGKYTHFPGQLV